MIIVLAVLAAAGIAFPHIVRLDRVSPVSATVVWLGSLALRALAAVLVAIYLLLFLPRTESFDAISHWCLHVALPAAAVELELDGHRIADLALYAPGALLAASLLLICVRTAHDARSARQIVAAHVLGDGPRNSLIVGGPEVVFAVAGLAHPRIVVSAGALAILDDDELAAGLDHEQAHIARCHRFVMLVAIVCGALGRAVPGCSRGMREVAFHLERDADRWALRRGNDQLALASVIYEAATADRARPPALVGLGDTGVRERLRQLLDNPPSPGRRSVRASLAALTTAMVVCTLLLGAVVPAATVAGVAADPHRGHHAHCDH